MKYLYLCLYALIILFFALINLSFAKESCLEEKKNNVKVEAWLSKKYAKNYRDIREEFLEIGNTKLGLFIYPAENPFLYTAASTFFSLSDGECKLNFRSLNQLSQI